MPATVLHLLGSFESGGSERQALRLAGAMRARTNWRVLIAAMDPAGPLAAEAASIAATPPEVFPLNGFASLSMVRQLARFRRLLRRERVDLLATHDFYSNVFGLTGGALAGTRARVGARRETEGLRTPTQRWVERRVFGFADSIVANAFAVQERLLGEGVASSKIEVIHNGVDVSRFPGGSSWPVRPVVTLLANFRLPVKDHPVFLKAAARLQPDFPDVRFVLAGEGPLLESMRDRAARLGLSRAAEFPGACHDVPALLAASNICVLSSRAEGFSNAILEYMAAGRPVVATDVGGAREMIEEGNSGFLIAPGDATAMAARLAELLRNPNRAQAFGRRGRELVEERFTIERQLEKTIALYRRLVKNEGM